MTAHEPRRAGRRPGEGDTRAEILDSARRLFAANGLKGTTVRAVALDAGCDPALVHHYFGSKHRLYVEAAEVPLDPDVVLGTFRDTPFDELGETICREVLAIWSSAAGVPLLARVRTAIGSGHGDDIGAMLGWGPFPLLVERVRDESGVDGAEARRRVALATTQVIGVLVARHLLEIPELTETDPERLCAEIAPVVQGRLDGTLLPRTL